MSPLPTRPPLVCATGTPQIVLRLSESDEWSIIGPPLRPVGMGSPVELEVISKCAPKCARGESRGGVPLWQEVWGMCPQVWPPQGGRVGNSQPRFEIVSKSSTKPDHLINVDTSNGIGIPSGHSISDVRREMKHCGLYGPLNERRAMTWQQKPRPNGG